MIDHGVLFKVCHYLNTMSSMCFNSYYFLTCEPISYYVAFIGAIAVSTFVYIYGRHSERTLRRRGYLK